MQFRLHLQFFLQDSYSTQAPAFDWSSKNLQKLHEKEAGEVFFSFIYFFHHKSKLGEGLYGYV